jgi:hypothetical protein
MLVALRTLALVSIKDIGSDVLMASFRFPVDNFVAAAQV